MLAYPQALKLRKYGTVFAKTVRSSPCLRQTISRSLRHQNRAAVPRSPASGATARPSQACSTAADPQGTRAAHRAFLDAGDRRRDT